MYVSAASDVLCEMKYCIMINKFTLRKIWLPVVDESLVSLRSANL